MRREGAETMTGGKKCRGNIGNGERMPADPVSDEFRSNLQAYHQLFINGPVVIFKWRNRGNWPVDYVSPNVKDIIGYAPEEFLNQHINFASIIHKEDVDTVTSELLYYCKMGIGDFNHAPYRIHKQDGTWIWISEHRCALKDDQGRITHFVGYIIDITDWKRSEAERNKDITERVKNQTDFENRAEILRRENLRLKSSIRDRFRLGNIVGKSEAMQAVYGIILKASESDANVVVCGESGTGKELVARAVHQLSDRSHKPFVVVNCGAVPETIIESEFFGYKKGAFTGADSDKPGYLDRAEGGSLFLDEVGEISLSMQVKLLRAIDGGGYTPVGGNEVKQSDIRIIAATNRDLVKLGKEGGLRADFFYRINVIPVTLPPLRERREDIPLLIEYMIASYGEGEELPPLTPVMIDAMLNHHWPGNIRELRNVLHRYLTLKKFDLMESPAVFTPEEEAVVSLDGGRDLKSIMVEYEKKLILKALDENCWHRGKVASLLSIDRKTLFTKIKSYHLKKNNVAKGGVEHRVLLMTK